MYMYKNTEPSLWTVGFLDNGKFHPESDWNTTEEAAARVMKLNGGGDHINEVAEMKGMIDAICDAHYNRGLRAAAAIVQTVIGELTEDLWTTHKEVLEKVYTAINKLKI